MKLLFCVMASRTFLKEAFVSFHRHFSEWKLAVNSGKTKMGIFSRGRVATSNYNFQFGEEEIEVVREHK